MLRPVRTPPADEIGHQNRGHLAANASAVGAGTRHLRPNVASEPIGGVRAQFGRTRRRESTVGRLRGSRAWKVPSNSAIRNYRKARTTHTQGSFDHIHRHGHDAEKPVGAQLAMSRRIRLSRRSTPGSLLIDAPTVRHHLSGRCSPFQQAPNHSVVQCHVIRKLIRELLDHRKLCRRRSGLNAKRIRAARLGSRRP